MRPFDEEWEAFKTTHNKKYDTSEDQVRKKIYLENKKKIEEHNNRYEKGEVSFTMGINQFSDRLPEEMKSCCGVKMPANANEK